MQTIAQFRAPFSDRVVIDALLMHVLNISREKLLSELSTELSRDQINNIAALYRRVDAGEPLALLIGKQSFWTMELRVTHDTLIPRPDTECLIEWILKNVVAKNLNVLDLGTGTGAIAIALALENPGWKIDVTDISEKALSIAKQNAKKYHCNQINFYHSDWFSALPRKKYGIIISNPPYIAQNDMHLAALTHEPSIALISGDAGLDAITHITQHAKSYLKSDGILIIEHGFDQAKQVMELFQREKFRNIISHHDLNHHPRFVTGVA